MADLQVVQFDPATGIASVAVGNVPKTLTGLDLLIQVVALSFLRNPGQDVVDPLEGSGLRADIGQYNISSDDQVKMHAIQQTKVVEKEVLDRQEQEDVDDPSERLLSLSIVDVGYDESSGAAYLRVQVTSEAGDTTDIVV